MSKFNKKLSDCRLTTISIYFDFFYFYVVYV